MKGYETTHCLCHKGAEKGSQDAIEAVYSLLCKREDVDAKSSDNKMRENRQRSRRKGEDEGRSHIKSVLTFPILYSLNPKL